MRQHLEKLEQENNSLKKDLEEEVKRVNSHIIFISKLQFS